VLDNNLEESGYDFAGRAMVTPREAFPQNLNTLSAFEFVGNVGNKIPVDCARVAQLGDVMPAR